MQCQTRASKLERRDDEIVHFLTNQLSVILGFAELIADDLPTGDPRRHGLDDILTAARKALGRLPELNERLLRRPAQ